MQNIQIAEKSNIHNWGLFAKKKICSGTLIIEHCPEGKFTTSEVNRLPQELVDRVGLFGSNFYLFYINHSCDPNCWWNEHGDLIARRKISKNEELTYDYSTHEVGYDWIFPWKCNCGANNCRKKITTKDILDQKIYVIYKDHLPQKVETFREKVIKTTSTR